MADLTRPARLTSVQWLICVIAAIGFAFDIYELLMMPLIARPALATLLHVDPSTDTGFKEILKWNAYIMWGSALCGGTFGLLGGYLTDWLGRRRVLTWSILLYAFSALAAGFSTSAEMLLVFRCLTFIGVCVEFVAAVAWLAELFPDPRQREAVLGYTQAFSSAGGILVTLAYGICVNYNTSFPAIYEGHEAWRYTLISGVIPALPLIIIRPFLPESPVWSKKRAEGTLKRPSVAALFAPQFRRTTLVTAFMFACSYGAAFGAIQFLPQIVPGLVQGTGALGKLRPQYEKAVAAAEAAKGSAEEAASATKAKDLKEQISVLEKKQQTVVKDVQLWQEIGGLVGRFVLAYLAIRIVSRRALMRVFQIPGLILIPIVFLFPAAGRTPEAILTALHTDNIMLLKIGIFIVGLLTVAQFSFWGNYLPRMYPVHLRGTGESFSANVGGRMVGTSANALTAALASMLLTSATLGLTRPASLAYAAAAVGFLVYALGTVACFFLPEPDPKLDEH
jgi:MFS family permease